jgi:nickel/cobalt transporter (NicO) family protein
MYQIFIGSLVLSLIHASIPNHWIPLITIGKTEKWSQRQTILATIITGFAHTLSTVIVGIVVGLIGFRLSSKYGLISDIIAPSILLCLGVVYLLHDFRGSHLHEHGHSHQPASPASGKDKWSVILTTLSIAMFLTPCVEIEAYYFQAGIKGWDGIFIVSIVYTLTTVLTMLILVYLGMKGINRFKSHFLEHHEKGITGAVLIALGLLAFFVKL